MLFLQERPLYKAIIQEISMNIAVVEALANGEGS
jgi:hypothetical protein